MNEKRGSAARRSLCLAAEVLVAEHGLEAVTLRRVAQIAGQRNVAAVTYHFGTIQQLLRATVEMRLQEAEAIRGQAIDTCSDPDGIDAFIAWLWVTRPALDAADELAPYAHVRFLLHMRLAGLLSDPFDSSVDRSGTPALEFWLECIRISLSHLPPHIAQARVGLCGLMFWNAIAIHMDSLSGHPKSDSLKEILLDVEASVRLILDRPHEAAA